MPKNVLNKKPLTITEAMEILQKRSEEDELSYWQRVAYEHAMQHARVDPSDSRKIVETLINEFEITELAAFSIANVLPTRPEELKDLLQKEPKILTDSEIKAIFDFLRPYVQKYLGE
ncbi:MAG: RNA polymerase Rpb4 family protein [Candidatus Heimdallarchaeaceae archaeon]|mgnify:CR=1 FL=1|uniref:DNA-directed RNA polymerase subunit Rpo4 n=1 Tax=Candidatus Heimdallarchaeum endolithica TaxID=2876572 RepID=A0A9Y1BP97_9ARCH|nr:MAG: RNA polymerase Rpb4 family protein [Candidatus Heimdallarchaeum endolithica]